MRQARPYNQCKATTKRGTRCPNAAGASGYCFVHDPDKSAERALARRLGGYNRRTTARMSGDEPVKVADISSVLTLINATIADTWVLENSPARSRVLLQAADVAMRAIQGGEWEARITALEARLNSGKP